MYKNSMIRATGLALATLLVAAAANAAEAPPATSTDSSVTVQGVQVAIDPATGRLVTPTAAQRNALSHAVQRAAQTPVRAVGQPVVPRNEAEARATFRTIHLKNGRTAVGMALPENLTSNLVAERRADGSLSIHHEGDSAPAAAPEVSQ